MSDDYIKLAVEAYTLMYTLEETRLEKKSFDRYRRRMKVLHLHERVEFAQQVAALSGMGKLRRYSTRQREGGR